MPGDNSLAATRAALARASGQLSAALGGRPPSEPAPLSMNARGR
jgi:hypothetical protein